MRALTARLCDWVVGGAAFTYKGFMSLRRHLYILGG